MAPFGKNFLKARLKNRYFDEYEYSRLFWSMDVGVRRRLEFGLCGRGCGGDRRDLRTASGARCVIVIYGCVDWPQCSDGGCGFHWYYEVFQTGFQRGRSDLIDYIDRRTYAVFWINDNVYNYSALENIVSKIYFFLQRKKNQQKSLHSGRKCKQKGSTFVV